MAEGSDRGSDLEFKRFLRISLGSVNEVVTGLYVALDLGFINEKEFNNLYQKSGGLTARIKALSKSLK